MSSDLPARGFFQQLHAKPVSGEHLEVLGKSASASYRSGKANTLSEAVVESVKHAGLSPEQVQRVIEFTNTDAFLYDFKKEGAQHRVVNLAGGPADPAEVFKDLNDGGGGSVFDHGASDYNHAPKTKKAAADPRVETALLQAFAASAPEYPYADPLSDAYDMKTKLAAAEEQMTGELSLLEGMYTELGERLYQQVKQAALEGTPLGQIVQAWAEAPGATPEHMKVAFSSISPRLVREGVFMDGPSLGVSLTKVATNQIVNVDHPLVAEFGEFCDTLTKMAQVRAAREEISTGFGQIYQYLKKASAEGVIKKVYDTSKGVGQAARPFVEGATGMLLGKANPHVQTVGRVVEKGLEHVPTALALVGANEVRRKLKYSPTYQGAKNTALQFVPGTPQYQQREYELASGGMGPGMGYGY